MDAMVDKVEVPCEPAHFQMVAENDIQVCDSKVTGQNEVLKNDYQVMEMLKELPQNQVGTTMAEEVGKKRTAMQRDGGLA